MSVERSLQDALTVADLIEELKNYPRDAKVLFQVGYGDYHNTQQALPVACCDSLEDLSGCLVTSAYSKSQVAIEEDEDREEFDNYIILSM